MKREFKRQIVDLLNEHRIMTIATNRADGWPQATVVGYGNDGLVIYCLDCPRQPEIQPISCAIRAFRWPSPRTTRSRCRSRACRSRPPSTEVTDTGEIDHVAEILLQRYPEHKVMPRPDPHAVPTLRLTPEIVSVIDYSKGFGHSDLVRVTDNDLAEFIEARRHHWAGFHADLARGFKNLSHRP